MSETISSVDRNAEKDVTRLSQWRLLSVLFKTRVVGLLLLAAIGGAFLAENGVPDWQNLVILLVAGGLSASGSGALNEYIEKDSDALMSRTRLRPLVVGTIEHPGWVPYVSVLMIAVPCLVMLQSNRPMAFFLFLGAFIYVGIYTFWLKSRTILNIVVGGAAGSAAVLSGSAAIGVWNDPGALVMAALLFSWTPMHFWSLAIVCRDDYMMSDIPMLPVYLSIRQSGYWIMLHTIITGLAALSLGVIPILGWFYFVPVLVMTLILVIQNTRLILYPSVSEARKLFHTSNIYLAVIILLICINISLA
ncbi:MAG: protoheme IX farnesyltransferase [Anaerolineaceae bacterium]|nr:protoheme IX farnesyltransferase [Anaerolineaceae bacterium]|tara:strand:+ start:72741 stop:73655 length:915 start_codon:yes stop_codon:yes gene_type:complete